MSRVVVHWFRRDLRLADNPALAAALAAGATVVPVYVHAPEDEGAWAPGAASRWWLHHSLAALEAALAARGARLVLLRGPVLESLLAVARATGAAAVHWNRLYEPALVQRDARIKAALREHGLEVESCASHLLFEPWTQKTAAGDAYRVFTPFWRAAQQQLAAVPPPLPAPERVPLAAAAPAGLALEELALLPRIRWDAGLGAAWTPGEAGALARLDAFCAEALGAYGEDRNRPDRDGTSRLSPHLHFGELSPRQALAAALGAHAGGVAAGPGVDAFVRELGWREFAHQLLYHFPQTPEQPLDRRFESFEYRHDAAALRAWQQGRTGYPLVDAGMRQLWHTGWMHNRVRMLVASLLTKNLGLSWREGVRWFHDTLVDADLANNVLGWQWTAGCGADASPYYRIFNPFLQSERFDPERAYLRRWLPELARLPDEWIHRPAEAPAEVLAAAGVVLGRDYPVPIVDFRGSRQRALDAWERLRVGGAAGAPGTPGAGGTTGAAAPAAGARARRTTADGAAARGARLQRG